LFHSKSHPEPRKAHHNGGLPQIEAWRERTESKKKKDTLNKQEKERKSREGEGEKKKSSVEKKCDN